MQVRVRDAKLTELKNLVKIVRQQYRLFAVEYLQWLRQNSESSLQVLTLKLQSWTDEIGRLGVQSQSETSRASIEGEGVGCQEGGDEEPADTSSQVGTAPEDEEDRSPAKALTFDAADADELPESGRSSVKRALDASDSDQDESNIKESPFKA